MNKSKHAYKAGRKRHQAPRHCNENTPSPTATNFKPRYSMDAYMQAMEWLEENLAIPTYRYDFSDIEGMIEHVICCYEN